MRVRKHIQSEIVLFLAQEIRTLACPGVGTVAAPGSRLLLAGGNGRVARTKGHL